MVPRKNKFRQLGILSLDTQFPRILGDVGNTDSYPFPAMVKVIEGADATKIVVDGLPDEVLLQRFETAASELEKQGADAIVSTCGFLITAQARIASKVSIPVMLSALSMLPSILAITGARVGVLTASRPALGSLALACAQVKQDDIVVQGMENDAIFTDAFLTTRDQQTREFDRETMEKAVVSQAETLIRNAPDIGAIVLECGNLPPYADAIRTATGRPVYHLLDGACWIMAAHQSTAYC
jgi:Asp/Glu/hydantoin racemase